VEAAGIEPASENIQPKTTTCLVSALGLASDTTQKPVVSPASFIYLALPPEAKGKASLSLASPSRTDFQEGDVAAFRQRGLTLR